MHWRALQEGEAPRWLMRAAIRRMGGSTSPAHHTVVISFSLPAPDIRGTEEKPLPGYSTPLARKRTTEVWFGLVSHMASAGGRREPVFPDGV